MSTIFNHPAGDVLAAVSKAARASERSGSTPIYQHLLLESSKDGSLTITGRCAEMQITVDTAFGGDHAGAICIPTRKLTELLKSFATDQIVKLTVNNGNGVVELKSGKNRFKLAPLPAADFVKMTPPQQQGQSLAMEQGQLRTLLSDVAFATALKDIRYYLNGAYLEVTDSSFNCVGTDGHRLAVSTVPRISSGAPFSMILHHHTVTELIAILDAGELPCQIGLSGMLMTLKAGDTLIQSNLLEGKYPDYRRVLPNPVHEMTVPRVELLDALHRARIFLTEKFHGITLSHKANVLQIQHSNPLAEEAVAEIDVEADHKAPVSIGVNLNYLIDGANMVKDPNVKIGYVDGTTAITIKSDTNPTWRYIIMPMRI